MVQANLFEILLIFIFHAITLFALCPSRFSRRKTAAVWCAVISAATAVCFWIIQSDSQFSGQLMGFFMALAAVSITVFYLSSRGFTETLFLFLTYSQAFVVAGFLAGFLSYHLFDGNPNVAILIRSLLQLAVVIVCVLFRGRFNELSQGIVSGWWSLDMLALLLLSYLSVLTLHAYTDFTVYSASTFVFLLIAVLAAVYWLFFYTIGCMHRAANAHQAEMKSELLQQRMEAMQNAIEEAARVRHDARHHNRQIAEYVRMGESEALLRYLDEYEQAAEEHQRKQICENSTADTILTVYGRKARQSGIDVHFDITLANDLAIRDMDFVAILANLFENAIHGCMASEKPEQSIDVQIGRKLGKLVIIICNTCGDHITMVNGLPRSQSGQGVGISSVLHSVKAYEGDIDFKAENGVFICRILLPYLTKA